MFSMNLKKLKFIFLSFFLLIFFILIAKNFTITSTNNLEILK